MARPSNPERRRTRRVSIYLMEKDYAELVRRAEGLEVAVPPSTLAAQLLSRALQKKPPARKH